ncbi:MULTISPECIES: hypothetical protein [Roseomonadaceae]|uniref:Uncharacterized protein n=1 Tax=Falsiroseomonas oleicola TaxID=2801474 RepID=A0ABS6HFT3_9PROT|nr:hypothetical protein [Roseomonas oleicola]MBU8546823.1 hypothetical protein [Roseomonas oleicola]
MRPAFMLAILMASSATAPAQAQMDVQQLVWQCGAAASDRGLTGSARDAFVQRCVDSDGRVGTESRRPPAPAARSTAWRLTAPTTVQWDLGIQARDRRSALSLGCGRAVDGDFLVMAHFGAPRGWHFRGEEAVMEIDGVRRRVQVNGADDIVTLSDDVQRNHAALSEQTLALLARGRSLRIHGLVSRGRPQTVTFDISGGAALFAAFERNCRSLR